MEIELISRETITPSTPTPPNLRIYPLSFFDHVFFTNYSPSLFFYRPNEVGSQDRDQTSKICELKKSLSQLLTRYYPFAGKFRDQLSIECNDQGVPFLVKRIRGTKLSTILQNPTDAMLNHLFPDGLQWEPMSPGGSTLAIQVSCFPCGGMSISVCLSHKVGDATTLFNFVNSWATMNREKGELSLPTFFLDGGVSVFPQGDLPVLPYLTLQKDNSVVARRFVFEASKIKSLKAMVSSQSHGVVQDPTRVQVVTALIYKCAVSALGLTSETTSLLMIVDLRRRMVPPLPEKCVGNMAWWCTVFGNPIEDRGEKGLPEMVSEIKGALSEFSDLYPNKFRGDDKDLEFISKCLKETSSCSSEEENDQTLFVHTSCCRFPAYESDFGWGKPIWVTVSRSPMNNAMILMDTRDGEGIEALVTMDEKDMAKFECNVDLLQYATLNPNREKCFTTSHLMARL